ncbi:MAG: hypothetical protein EP343_17495 [Deltaproteobacteria bacterium]|nr:MAG: hypothetical protein EP343_17495 [Deltaproteobacteria bacterium]
MMETSTRSPAEQKALEASWSKARRELLEAMLQVAQSHRWAGDVGLIQDLQQSHDPIDLLQFQNYWEDDSDSAILLRQRVEEYQRWDREWSDHLADLEVLEQQRRQANQRRNIVLALGGIVGLVAAVLFLTPDTVKQTLRRSKILDLPKFKTFGDVSYFSAAELAQSMALQPPKLTKKVRSYAALHSPHTTSLWGPLTHVWMYRDKAGHVQDLIMTGHAETRVRHKWWSLLYNTALTQKHARASRLLLSGVARLSFRYNCPQTSVVKTYLQTQVSWRERWQRSSQNATTTSLAQVDDKLKALNTTLSTLRKQPDVKKYIQCVEEQGRSFLSFSRQAKQLFVQDGLSVRHVLPHSLWKQAHKRLKEGYGQAKKQVVGFADLLKQAKAPSAVMSFSVRWRSSGKPVVFRLPKATLMHESLPRARRIYRKELEHVMLGNAREREVLYKRRLEINEEHQRQCKNWKRDNSPRLRKKIQIEQICSSDGRCHMATSPIVINQSDYCERYVPLNLLLARMRLRQIQELLKRIQSPANQALLETFVSQAMWDALLRNAPLPVGQYQGELWQWQAHTRRKLWSLLYQQMMQKGVPVHALAQPHVVFRVRVEGDTVAIRPVWIVDLRSTTFRFSPEFTIPIPEVRSTSGSAARSCRFAAFVPSKIAPKPSPQGKGKQVKTDSKQANKLQPKKEPEPQQLLEKREELQNLCGQGKLAEEFLRYWQRNQNTQRVFGKLSEMGQTFLDVRDTLQAFRAISSETLIRKGLFYYIGRLYRILRDYRTTPPELHAQLAYITAVGVARYMKRISNIPLTAWDVLSHVAGLRTPRARAVRKLRYDSRYEAYNNRFYMDVRRYPIALISQAVSNIRSMDSWYYKDWVRRKGSPQRRSRLMASLDRFYPPSSLMEQHLLDFLRAKRHLQTYLALQSAAQYVLHKQVPRLRGLFKRLSMAPLLTEADSLIVRRIQDSVGVVAEDTHIDSSKLRMLASTQMQRSARDMLQKSQELLASYALSNVDTPALRLLQARILFEQGLYRKMLQVLCKTQTPLAYFRPELRWKVVGSDWTGGVQNIQAEIKDEAVVISASQQGPPKPLLRITGLSAQDQQELVERLQSLGALQHPKHKASEQILMLSVSLPTRVLRVFQRLQQADVAAALVRDMVYSCKAPGSSMFPVSRRCRFPFLKLP